MLIRALVILCLSATFANAQSKNIGRLSDGRAFRIDQSGMRLIDQVAELEVTNDDFKRQVVALEDELKEKNGIIESLRAGVKIAPEDRLREQDLLGNTASGLPKAATAACDRTEVEQLKLKLSQQNSNQASTDSQANVNNQELSKLKVKVMQLEEENMKSKDRIALLTAEKNQMLAQLQGSKTTDSERSQLALKIAKLEQERTKLLEDNDSLKNTIAQKDQAASRESEQETQKLKQELASLKEQLVETQQEALKLQEANSRSRMVEPVKVELAKAPIRNQSSPESKNLLTAIQSKIMKRKSLLDNVSKSGKGISLSATNLVTANGLSLDRLRQEVNSGSVDASTIKGLTEISNILDADISTASRLSH